jgi:WD40 repeat protein
MLIIEFPHVLGKKWNYSIFTVIASSVIDNIIFSLGSDNKIKIWDISNKNKMANNIAIINLSTKHTSNNKNKDIYTNFIMLETYPSQFEPENFRKYS